MKSCFVSVNGPREPYLLDEPRTMLGPLEKANQVRYLRLALSKGPNRVGISLPLPEDGNRPSFRNVVFQYLEFRAMDKVQILGSSEYQADKYFKYGNVVKPISEIASLSDRIISKFIHTLAIRNNKKNF
jgi:hypothetical protein